MRILWHIAGFQALRKSPQITADITERVAAVAAACGEGYDSAVTRGGSRVRGTVVTATPRAMADNASNNTLVNNLEAGR